MSNKTRFSNTDFDNIDPQLVAQAEGELQDAYDFDAQDPLFGLSKEQLSGPRLGRRSVLRLMAAAGALTLTDVLAGCAPASSSSDAGGAEAPAESSAGTAAAGGELICGWAGTAEITTLDPAQINQVLQFQMASNVLSGLTHIDADLTAQGDLAETWAVSDDGLEWSFSLREGVTWHNGDALTADDVVYTFNRSKDPEQSIHSAVVGNVLSVEKVDDLTVKLTLEKPQASLLVKTLERSKRTGDDYRKRTGD